MPIDHDKLYIFNIHNKKILQSNIFKNILHKTGYTNKWSSKNKLEIEQKTKYKIADLSPNTSVIKLINKLLLRLTKERLPTSGIKNLSLHNLNILQISVCSQIPIPSNLHGTKTQQKNATTIKIMNS